MSRLCVRYSTDRYLQKKIKWSVNDMNMTASELREALLFDPETDSDLATLEAACDIADMNYTFAMESAYEDSDDEIATEAVDVSGKIEAVKKFLKTLAAKISNWVRGVMQSIKNQFGKIKKKMQAKAIKRATKSIKGTTSADTAECTQGEYEAIEILNGRGYSVWYLPDLADLANKDMNTIKSEMGKTLKSFAKANETLKSRSTNKTKTTAYKIDGQTLTSALSNLTKVMQLLNSTANDISKAADRLKNTNSEKVIVIRTVCSRISSELMKMSRLLFSRTISVANRFTKGVEKSASKTAKETIKKAYK